MAETAVRGICTTPDARIALAAVLAARMGLRRAEIAAASVEDIVDGTTQRYIATDEDGQDGAVMAA